MQDTPSLPRGIAVVELRGWFFAAFCAGIAFGLVVGLAV